ncbi:MAG: hypothetical protein WBZ67_25300, partial [Pseudolabrys sp.]
MALLRHRKTQIEVRFRCKSGHTARITAMTGFDRMRACAAGGPCDRATPPAENPQFAQSEPA